MHVNSGVNFGFDYQKARADAAKKASIIWNRFKNVPGGKVKQVPDTNADDFVTRVKKKRRKFLNIKWPWE